MAGRAAPLPVARIRGGADTSDSLTLLESINGGVRGVIFCGDRDA